MERSCKDLKEHETKITNYEIKIPLTDEEEKQKKAKSMLNMQKKIQY